MIRQTAEVENNMNSVERIVHYAREIEQEAPHELPDCKSPTPWPSKGAITLDSVVFKYRPELPTVLKGISIVVNGGEKIGIVGRFAFLWLGLFRADVCIGQVLGNHRLCLHYTG
jgi:ABC-type bacteriocin/lantibiotic exporter with double-glycine peptidase domain